VWPGLRSQGHDVARCTVERLLATNGWAGTTRGKGVRTTIRDEKADRPADLVDRDSTATAPNQLWVADFTCGNRQPGCDPATRVAQVKAEALKRRLFRRKWCQSFRLPPSLPAHPLDGADDRRLSSPRCTQPRCAPDGYARRPRRPKIDARRRHVAVARVRPRSGRVDVRSASTCLTGKYPVLFPN
jgi:transposase InsO family protein